MIVNYTEVGWEVITQRAHGAEFRAAFRKAKVSEKRWVFKKEKPLMNKRPS